MNKIRIVLLGLIACNGFWAYRYFKRLQQLTQLYKGVAAAEIVELREEGLADTGNNPYRCYPTFEYTVDGTAIRKASSWGYPRKAYLFIGRKMTLHYDTANPECFIPREDEKMLKQKFHLHAAGVLIFTVLLIPAFLWFA